MALSLTISGPPCDPTNWLGGLNVMDTKLILGSQGGPLIVGLNAMDTHLL